MTTDTLQPAASAPRIYRNYSRPLPVRLLANREAAIIALLVAVFAWANLNVENFDGPLTLYYLFLDMAPILLIALPMTLVIVTGEIDLSVASAQQGVGGLIVSANDPEAICDALNEARDAGTKVVTFDSDTNPECRDLFINQATAEGIAKVQVDLIAEQIGDKGEIAILSAAANATNQNAWIDMMEEELAANHPDMELVDTVYGDDDDQTSFDKTSALLQSHPNLKGIISPTTVGIAAAARYLSDSEYKGKVALTGLGTPNQMREYVENGTVTAFALWNPGDLGYLAAYATEALISGDITGEEGDTFEAGDLGEYTVEEDGTVLLGDPFVFDKDNIGDFDF